MNKHTQKEKKNLKFYETDTGVLYIILTLPASHSGVITDANSIRIFRCDDCRTSETGDPKDLRLLSFTRCNRTPSAFKKGGCHADPQL